MSYSSSTDGLHQSSARRSVLEVISPNVDEGSPSIYSAYTAPDVNHNSTLPPPLPSKCSSAGIEATPKGLSIPYVSTAVQTATIPQVFFGDIHRSTYYEPPTPQIRLITPYTNDGSPIPPPLPDKDDEWATATSSEMESQSSRQSEASLDISYASTSPLRIRSNPSHSSGQSSSWLTTSSDITTDSTPQSIKPTSRLARVFTRRRGTVSQKSDTFTEQTVPSEHSNARRWHRASRSRPNIQRSLSELSSQSSNPSSNISGTTLVSSAKLTHKFPMPVAKSQRKSNTMLKSENRYLNNNKELWDESEEGDIKRLQWTRAKCILLISVLALFTYGCVALMMALATWFRAWSVADVAIVSEHRLMVWITFAACACMMTSILGLTGTMLNSRPILAVYSLLLWPTFLAILVVGYTAYRKEAYMLDRKLNFAWSRFFDDSARLRIQDSLRCCGYYNPLHEATFSRRCYPRTTLPGCKGKLYRFEKSLLATMYTIAFSLVPVHILVILIGLLCSNHVNRTFGKGLMPRPYRLNMADVKQNAMDMLKALPTQPNRGIRRKHTGSSRSSRSDFESMPRSDSASSIYGLGFKEQPTGSPL